MAASAGCDCHIKSTNKLTREDTQKLEETIYALNHLYLDLITNNFSELPREEQEHAEMVDRTRYNLSEIGKQHGQYLDIKDPGGLFTGKDTDKEEV